MHITLDQTEGTYRRGGPMTGSLGGQAPVWGRWGALHRRSKREGIRGKDIDWTDQSIRKEGRGGCV